MTLRNEIHAESSQASLSNPLESSRSLLDEVSDGASVSSDEIIYTPPESVCSMASSTGDNISPPAPGVTVTASHGTLPSSKYENVSGAASNISKREYIYFLPYPLPAGTEIPYSIYLPEKNPLNLPSHQFEPTSTLVLTSPLRTFVDIRVYKPFDTATAASANSANQGSLQRLEWAFAGSSTSVPVQSDGKEQQTDWENVTHSTWTHWLDSRFPVGDPDIPTDEGDMYPLADDLTLEVGHAEMWRDVEVVSTSESQTMVCVVMRCQDDAAGVRGVVVRVGQYVQGIVIQGEAVTAERWEWDAERQGEQEAAKWQRTVRVGNSFLPCAVCFRPGALAVGGKVRFRALEWVVEEVWEWT